MHDRMSHQFARPCLLTVLIYYSFRIFDYNNVNYDRRIVMLFFFASGVAFGKSLESKCRYTVHTVVYVSSDYRVSKGSRVKTICLLQLSGVFCRTCPLSSHSASLAWFGGDCLKAINLFPYCEQMCAMIKCHI